MKISPSPVCRPLENHRTATPSTSVERRDIDVPPTATAAASAAAAASVATSEAISAAIVLSLAFGFLAWNFGNHPRFLYFFFFLDFNCWLVSF